MGSQECSAGSPTRRALGRVEHFLQHSMAAPTSPGSEDTLHIQCVRPALKGERTRVHHSLATLLWSEIARLADEWCLHRELKVDGLRGIPVPMDSMMRGSACAT